MTVSVTTGPTVEPMTTADAKAHLRVTGYDDDYYVDGLIAAARMHAENFTGTVFIKRSLRLTLDRFPEKSDAAIILPTAPVQSIESIVYTNLDGDGVTWDASKYVLDADTKRPRILPAYNQSWPSDARHAPNAIQINFIAGYADDGGSPPNYRVNVPAPIIHALKLLIGHWYENRMEVVTGTTAAQVPMAALNLLWPYKIKAF